MTVISLIAVGGSLTALLVYKSSTDALRISISNSQTNEARQTVDKMDRFLYERTVDMQSLAGRQQIQDFLALPPAARPPATAAALVKQMDDFKSSSGSWNEFTIVDKAGIQPLPSSLQNLQNILTKQAAVLKLYADASSGQAGYSDALEVAKGQQPVMLFMQPVHNQLAAGHPIVGVLVGEVAWQANLDILRTSQSTTATLINNKGLSLGDNQPDSGSDVLSRDFSSSSVFKAATKADSGAGVFSGLKKANDSFVTAYARESGFLDYHGNNWILVLETPEAVAFAPAAHLAKTLIATFSGILILSVFALLMFLRILVLKPIGELEKVTGRLSKGDFSLRTSVKSNDELGNLSNDFNDMADSIQLAYKNLRLRTKEAQDEKIILETLLENLPIGVLVVSAPDGKPITMNKVGKQIIGRDVEGVEDISAYIKAFDIIKEDGSQYPDGELPLAATLRTGQVTVKDDMVFRRPDGGLVPVRVADAPIRDADGVIRRAVSVFEDISIERNLERSREEFFSIASHELRTPLTAIRGNTSMIHDQYWNKLPNDDIKEMISDIHESSTRLIEIVNDFLDTSRLEQKRMNFNFEVIDLVEVAESVMKEYIVTGSQQKIQLEVIKPDPPLPKVLADRNRTKQVLINLVGNALKFTEAGSVIISFKIEGHTVKTLVADTGKGISEESQKFLFKKFEQAGTTVLTRDSVRGAGLGLYISKLIIEQMKGHIGIDSSQLGVGTTFGFSLPITTNTLPGQPSSAPRRLGEITHPTHHMV